jgi:hypothetical protein
MTRELSLPHTRDLAIFQWQNFAGRLLLFPNGSEEALFHFTVREAFPCDATMLHIVANMFIQEIANYPPSNFDCGRWDSEMFSNLTTILIEFISRMHRMWRE